MVNHSSVWNLEQREERERERERELRGLEGGGEWIEGIGVTVNYF